MSSITTLSHRVEKLLAQVGPPYLAGSPCLVPPPDMPLFTEQEQDALRSLEQCVVPLIPTGLGSVIERLGGPHLALYAIKAPVGWAFNEMGVYEQAKQELSRHDWWFLVRWWHFYKDLIIPSGPQEARNHQRRHFFRTPEELLERFLSIDMSQYPELTRDKGYPINPIGYASIMHDIENNKRVDWHTLELWYDFIESRAANE